MFEVDMFDKTKVVYKPYRFIKMAMIETISTWEDSSAMHKRLSNDIGTTLYKVKSFILDVTTNLLDIVNVGDKVNVDTRLYTISASDVNTSKLDSKSLEILQRLGMNSPKAKYNGIVDKIEVRYHAELEDCSESIQELIKRSDAELAKSTGKKHITGKVDNQYSINGKPLNYGELEVKFYIEVKVGLEPGDKFVFGLQLKNTVGELIDYNITTAKTKEDIDAMFSRRSVSARIVTSPDIQGTTNTLLKQLGKNAVKMYKS